MVSGGGFFVLFQRVKQLIDALGGCSMVTLIDLASTCSNDLIQFLLEDRKDFIVAERTQSPPPPCLALDLPLQAHTIVPDLHHLFHPDH